METNVVVSWLPIEGRLADCIVSAWATDLDGMGGQSSPNATRQRQSIVGHAALRALLAAETGSSAWRLVFRDNGKPVAVDPEGRSGPLVSLSHGGGLVAVALGHGGVALGVDIEPHRSRRFADLARQAFGPGERRAVENGGMELFYRVWTLREAMAKATGEGLSLAGDGRDRVPFAINRASGRCGAWQLMNLVPAHDYSMAVALLGAMAMRLRIHDFEEYYRVVSTG